MKPAVLAALLGMAAPAVLLAQTPTPPTDPAVTASQPAGDAAGSALNGTTAATGATGAASQNPVVMPHSEGAPEPATAPATTATPAVTPQDFVNQAASSGMFEVRSSELALERASSTEVKDFARMMIRDHGELNEQLKAVAAAKGLTVPAEIAGPPARHMQAVTGAEGGSFDQAYLDHQAQAHAEAIALFEPWAARTDDSDLAALAQKAVQHIRTHQERLETIRAD